MLFFFVLTYYILGIITPWHTYLLYSYHYNDILYLTCSLLVNFDASPLSFDTADNPVMYIILHISVHMKIRLQ